MPTINIRVDDGAVVCTPSGGNVRLRPGKEITWVSREAFTLQTFRVPVAERMGPRLPTPGWPFNEKPTHPPNVVRVEKPGSDGRYTFTGTLQPPGEDDPDASEPGVYKCSITVGELGLDPIIIVDR